MTMSKIPVVQQFDASADPTPTSPQKTNLLGMSKTELSKFFAELGEKPFRATQVMKWEMNLYH